MDATRFDAATRTLAHGLPRRRFMGLLTGIAGFFLPPAILPAAASTGFNCSSTLKCPTGQCVMCQVSEDGKFCGCVCKKCGTVGIAGGGSDSLADGTEAHLALLATRQPLGDVPGDFAVEGQVRWTDPGWEGTGLTLVSTTVNLYGPLPDVENGREVIGYLESPQQSGDFPYVLNAVAANPGEIGTATVAIWAGDAILDDPDVAATFDPVPARSGFGYAAAGTLVTGDLQLLNFALDSERT